VRRWCVLGANNSDMGGDRVTCFIKHFLNKLGISYLEFRKYTWKNIISIDSLTQHGIHIEKDNIEGIDKNCSMDYGEMIK
jgi:hypothetical protein